MYRENGRDDKCIVKMARAVPATAQEPASGLPDVHVRRSAGVDWNDTTYTVDCAGPLTVTVRDGYGETDRDGTLWGVAVRAVTPGDLVGGPGADEVAVLLTCGPARTDEVGTLVQVYRDGPNLLDELTPPHFPTLPYGQFLDDGLRWPDAVHRGNRRSSQRSRHRTRPTHRLLTAAISAVPSCTSRRSRLIADSGRLADSGRRTVGVAAGRGSCPVPVRLSGSGQSE
jgi:hypothetical protein